MQATPRVSQSHEPTESLHRRKGRAAGRLRLYLSTIMFKQFISKIPGADLYMVGSFMTFFVFFVLVGLYLWLADKNYLQQMSRLPFDDSSTD